MHCNEVMKYTLSTAGHGHYDEVVTFSMAAFVAVSSTKVVGFSLEYYIICDPSWGIKQFQECMTYENVLNRIGILIEILTVFTFQLLMFSVTA